MELIEQAGKYFYMKKKKKKRKTYNKIPRKKYLLDQSVVEVK